MKRIATVLSLVLIISGCTRETGCEETVGKTVLEAYLSPLSKTEIDGATITWSAGDAICVNGSVSRPLASGGPKADFVFDEDLAAPFRALYPAALYKDNSTVCLPSEWRQSSFGPPLAGYAETGNSVSFSSISSLIKLSISGDCVLKDVALRGLGGEQVSGDFSLDYQSGTLSGLSSAEDAKCVKVICDYDLGLEPLTVYIPVPPGSYGSGLQVEMTGENGETLVKKTSARTLKAGELRSMPELVLNSAPVSGGISSASDFAAFAAAVNSGASTEAWQDGDGVVKLLNDIDFSGVDNWTPVGAALACWKSNQLTVAGGTPFSGKFNGCGHTIKNLNVSVSISDGSVDKSNMNSVCWGIFGFLAPGAVVENFTIDSSCSFSFTASSRADIGIVAGVLDEATVRNVTNEAAMSLDNKNDDDIRVTMAMVGFAFSDIEEAVIDNLTNSGAIAASTGNNTKNGATGVHAAGILGFGTNRYTASGNESSVEVVVSDCTNHGNLNTDVGRAAGIVAAANRYTRIVDCINHGHNFNSFPTAGGGRIGNITCVMTNAGSSILNSSNFGDVICSTAARAGGVASLIGNKNIKISRTANYGRVITDETTYRGTFFQQCNVAATFENCIAAGDVGDYNGGNYNMVGVNADNYFDYVGFHNTSATYVTPTNIRYGDAPVLKGIETIEDLVAFARALNSGADVSGWLVDGKLQILSNMDASSVSEWIPIGTSVHPMIYDIDGMGHSIKDIHWTIDTDTYVHAGFVGYGQNISISDLTLGTSGSCISFNGNPGKLRAGGIIGYVKGLTMNNVVNNADLTVTGNSAYGNNLIIGGLAGYADSYSKTENCVNNGNVFVPLVCQEGGLVGYNSGTVTGCTNNGIILGAMDGSQYGPAWGCSYNKTKGNFTGNMGGGMVGDWSIYASDPGSAPASNHYNAIWQNYESSYDPTANNVDWTLDSYYDWTALDTRRLHDAVTYTHYSFDNVPRHMHVLEIDLSNPGIELSSAVADGIIPNPNGRDNDHLDAGFVLRETLSRLCARKRSEGDKVIAGVNAGFFDSYAGILRGFHVENGEPLYINNPKVVSSLSNHRWGFCVFSDGTASCGKKVFTGTLRTGGKEYPFHTVNDTTLRHSSPVDSPVNLFTSRYRKTPHPEKASLVNELAKDVLYVICEYIDDHMRVNRGYVSASVVSIMDGRSTPLTDLPYISAENRIGIALSGDYAAEWAASVKPGDTVEFRCDIAIDGDSSKPILSLGSTMYQLMTDGEDASNTPGSSASLYSKYDPMTFPVVSQDRRKVWLVEVDGRQGWYSMGVKGYEMYRIARKLGGWWVTRFDGGGSSSMWVWNSSTQTGSIVSKPADSKGERSCMSYLIVKEK